MPRALWTGWIRFGLVNVPVKLYPAVKNNDIHFHLLHDQDSSRIRNQVVDSRTGKPVDREDIVKGYELHKGKYLIVDQKDLEKLEPESSRDIRVTEFVDPTQINPIYVHRAYYLGPDKGGAKAYSLLVEALKKTKKAGITHFVMRKQEYLAALRVIKGDVLCLETMRFANEIVDPSDVSDFSHEKVNPREIKMAEQLIDSLESKWQPTHYKDEFTDRVMDLIEKKRAGKSIDLPKPHAAKPTHTSDLMKVLQQSVVAARRSRRHHPGHTPQRRGR
jgi:DNA end-binding protein Ku